MAANMEALMFSMFIMFNMHVHMCMCVCVHVHVCMHGTPPHAHTHLHPIHPSATPPGGDPRNQLKFDNT